MAAVHTATKQFRWMIMIMVMVFFTSLGCTVTHAYSLDDVNNDYGGLKIKTTQVHTDYGRDVTLRYARLMSFGTRSADPSSLDFFLYEQDKTTKFVRVFLHYSGNYRVLWDHLTIDDGTRVVSVYPDYPTQREAMTRDIFIENMTFTISTKEDLEKWKNAKKIQVIGARYYDAFKFKSDRYDDIMETIERYLFEP